MELEIQKFIRRNPNWRELLSAAPYNLKISEENGFVLFKYNQIKSDFNYKICKEARGIILDSFHDFKVVRFAFKKFFNLEESFADKIDWASTTATEKIDGSLISLWFANGQWNISTNGTIFAENAELANNAVYKNFRELFDAAAQNSGLDFSRLDTNMCYTFELISKFNKIVLNYNEPALYHLLTRDMRTLEEVEVDIGIQKPKSYNLNSKEDYKELVSKMDETHEGIVVKDKFNKRVKIKTETYFQLHHMANNGTMTLERIVSLILANDQEEFLSYFSEWKDKFEIVKKQVSAAQVIIEEIKKETEEWKKQYQNPNSGQLRKWFAEDVINNKYAPLFFAAFDNKLDNLIEKLTPEKFIRIFNITMED